ncbi:hydrolase [Pseudoalteromonas citrea]|uniref:Hydrolase n=1 Tax=Pseudoalteromonas citrea TaxID=43655 RepID=A0A5S3XP28_9GAMM|nr:HAD-IIB family hydrolase [Pseudoalteromonas citrea]TMP40140.1 hydrolase [Pseudoalteromonas citrea]TMP56854.1 hydrolase [Pseudoalteromonas citrea]
MKGIKNFVFDLDGTLIFEGKPLTSALSNTLIELEAAGINTYFATARPLRDTLPVLPEYFWDHTLIGCNGAMTSKQQKVTSANAFKEAQIVQLLEWLDDKNIAYLYDGHYDYAVSDKPHEFHQWVAKLGTQPSCNTTLRQQQVIKLLILEGHHFDEINTYCEQHLDTFTYYHHSGTNCFDIVTQHSNKLSALQALQLDLSKTICFGNDHNDVAMLNAAHKAVVVGDGISLSRNYTSVCRDTILEHLTSLLASKVAS